MCSSTSSKKWILITSLITLVLVMLGGLCTFLILKIKVRRVEKILFFVIAQLLISDGVYIKTKVP